MINLAITGIKEIETIANKTEGCISLSQGVLKVGGIPFEIKQYLKDDVLSSYKSDYYENQQSAYELKTKLSCLFDKKYKAKIPTNQIVLTHGCIGGLSVLLLSLLDIGSEVIIPEPTYPVYQNIVTLARGNPVFVSCLEKSKDNINSWALNIEKIKSAVTEKTRAIIFSNPWNPLGCIISKEILIELANFCEKKGIYLIVDEVYEDYIFEGEFFSTLSLIPNSSHVIRSCSFSKNFGMSGWRIGYLVLPTALVDIFSIAQHSLLVAISQLGLHAASFALEHPELLKKFYDIIYKNLYLSEELLKPLVDQNIITYQKPKAGFFLFIQSLKEGNINNECMNMIQKAGVAIIPGNKFGPSGEGCMRLCYAREKEILQEGIVRFVNYWKSF